MLEEISITNNKVSNKLKIIELNNNYSTLYYLNFDISVVQVNFCRTNSGNLV